MTSQEIVILKSLIKNEDYLRRVLPFLKEEYFSGIPEKLVFKEIQSFILQYNKPPTMEALEISVWNKKGVSETDFKRATDILKEIKDNDEKSDLDWLCKETEQFCQDKAIENAIHESILILDAEKNKKKIAKTRGAIPQLLADALGVSLDTNVGHDYIEKYEDRYKSFHTNEKRIPFDVDLMNEITRGGLKPKTLNMFLAGVNVGKSLVMCHIAATCLSMGLNVLYLTMEMAEEEIGIRIDSNLFNIAMEDLEKIPKETYEKKIDHLRKKTTGKLIIKEYPSTGASVIHFRALLNELWLKKHFKPNIIIVDYINICASARINLGANGVNTNTYIKAISEELRGLAQEYNVPLVSATQLNRGGFTSSDVDLDDVAESFGLTGTADLIIGMMTTEELEKADQLLFKQLKSRYNSKKKHKRFVVGIDTSKMRIYNVEQQAQENIVQDTSKPIPAFSRKRSGNFSSIKV